MKTSGSGTFLAGGNPEHTRSCLCTVADRASPPHLLPVSIKLIQHIALMLSIARVILVMLPILSKRKFGKKFGILTLIVNQLCLCVVDFHRCRVPHMMIIAPLLAVMSCMICFDDLSLIRNTCFWPIELLTIGEFCLISGSPPLCADM